jgi:hypothetical protein
MSAIRWTDGSAGVLFGWVVDRLSSLAPTRMRSKKIDRTASGRPDLYSTVFQAPLKRHADFRKAAELALPQLMPVRIEDLVVYGRHRPDGVELAAFRRTDIEHWSRSKGSSRRSHRPLEISEGWSVVLPEQAKGASRKRASIATAIALSIAAAAAFYFDYLSSLDRQLQELLSQEQQLRSAALVLAKQQEEANLWGSLRSAHAEARLPASVLASLAEMSRSTPSNTSWARVEWTPTRATIGGFSADPISALAGFSSIKGAKASFSKPVSSLVPGKQEYEVAISFAESPK